MLGSHHFNLSLAFLFSFVKISFQRIQREECTGFSGDFTDPIRAITDIAGSAMKGAMMDSLADPRIKSKLPKEISLNFLKSHVDRFVDNKLKPIHNRVKNSEKSSSVMKNEPKPCESSGNPLVTENYRPYGGKAFITNWSDLYHYYPEAGKKIRMWKLQFKELAKQNKKKFKKCINPGAIVDLLVPDVDEIKRRFKRNRSNKIIK